MASTHFAAVHDGIVIGTRSSASRHVEGSGKFGVYTCAVAYVAPDTGKFEVVTWHGSTANGQSGLKAWDRMRQHRGAGWAPVGVGFLVPVVVTAKRAEIGSKA